MINKKIETKIYASSIKSLEDKRLYNIGYNIISTERKQKIDKFKFEKSKKLSLMATLLLNFALKEFELSENKIEFEYNEHEKPYIKDSNIYFNLSHSDEYAICAISDSEIGCDIEKIRNYDDKIAKRFFHPKEYEKIIAITDKQFQRDLFFRYWTLKESFIKNTGLGLSTPLDSFQIVLENNISVIQNLNENKYYFKEFPEIEGYKCAMCALTKCDNIKLKILDINTILGE